MTVNWSQNLSMPSCVTAKRVQPSRFSTMHLTSWRKKQKDLRSNFLNRQWIMYAPVIEVKSRRVGGSTYQVPTEVRPSRRTALGIRWIIGYARKRPEKGMAKSLLRNLWMPPTTGELLPRKEKTPTKWRKPTKRLPIFAGKLNH